MDRNSSTERTPLTSLSESFERLQDKGKGRGGDGGNYRRNAARELERFAEVGPPATAATTTGPGSSPTTSTESRPSTISTNACSGSTPGISVEIGDSSRTRYKPTTAISPRGVAGVSTRAISRRITRSGRVRWRRCRRTMAASPGDQQAWTSEQRHAFTRYVDERARRRRRGVHDTPGGN